MEVLFTMPKGIETTQVSVTLANDLLKKVDEQAGRLYLSRSAFIVTAIAQKVQSEELLRTLPQFTETIRMALNSEKAKSDLRDIIGNDTDMPYMDATREGAEKLDFMQGLNEDIAKAKK